MPPAPSSSGGLYKPRAVLFDWDNTLVDTWPIIHDATNWTLRAFSLPEWTFDETRRRVRKSMRDSFPKLFGDRWQEAGEVFYTRYAEIHADKVAAIPGAEDALIRLSDAGIYLGVISNKKGEFLRREAVRLGWDRFFGAMVGAFDAARDKPAPDVIEMALDASGIRPGPKVWVAGDADIDLECAINAGCTPILVRAAAPAPGELDAHPPAGHFPGCDALCKCVFNL